MRVRAMQFCPECGWSGWQWMHSAAWPIFGMVEVYSCRNCYYETAYHKDCHHMADDDCTLWADIDWPLEFPFPVTPE